MVDPKNLLNLYARGSWKTYFLCVIVVLPSVHSQVVLLLPRFKLRFLGAGPGKVETLLSW